MKKKTPPKPKLAMKVTMPAHTLTTAQWQGNPSIQTQLQDMLDSPIFKMACQTLLVTAMPNAKPFELIPGVTADAMALADSNRYHHRSGFTQFYRGLHNLARPVNSAKRGADWGELLQEDE